MKVDVVQHEAIVGEREAQHNRPPAVCGVRVPFKGIENRTIGPTATIDDAAQYKFGAEPNSAYRYSGGATIKRPRGLLYIAPQIQENSL